MKKLIPFLVLLMLGSSVIAQRGPRNDRQEEGRDKQAMRERFLDRLDLTEDQKGKIEAFRLDHMKQTQQINNQLNIKRAQLQASVTSENPNKKEIDGLIDEISELNKQQMSSKVYHQMDVRGVLTDEQKVKFDMHRKHMGKQHQHGKGHHGI